jgi:hypothetical protein
MKQDRRYIPNAELRVETREGEAPKIVGYAAVFNSLSENLGGFREIIKPGAFKKSLTNDVRALIDHESGKVLGRSKAGTLRMVEDDKGLRVEIDPPDTTIARDLLESMRRGDIDQMSFGFFVKSDNWRKQDGENIRELEEVDLFDVSIVTFPAYPATSVHVRSLTEDVNQENVNIPEDPKPPIGDADYAYAALELAKRV